MASSASPASLAESENKYAASCRSNDLVVCAIVDQERDSLLLVDQAHGAESEQKRRGNLFFSAADGAAKAYWLPYTKPRENESTLEVRFRWLMWEKVYLFIKRFSDSE